MKPKHSLRNLLLSSIAMSALVACGGGGGDDGGGVIVFPTGPAADWHLTALNYDAASSLGLTGAGIIVALVDTGIDIDHPDLMHAISPDSVNLSNVFGPSSNIGHYVSGSDHGTAMAGLIVGLYNEDEGTGGLAPNATLLVIKADSSLGGFAIGPLADAIIYAVDNGADIINLSLGGNYEPYSDFYDPDVEAVKYAAANGVIVFMATGNDGNDLISGMPAYYAGTPEFGETSVAVTALDENNEIAYFAQPCDVVNPYYCIAVPGQDITTTADGGGYDTGNGTSQATAIASGSMALLLEYFPNLTNAEAVEIMLITADDLGAPGVDNVYGSGALNLQAALQPIGTLTFNDGSDVSAIEETKAVASTSVFGSFKKVEALSTLQTYDDYQRNYGVSLESRITTAEDDDITDEFFTRNLVELIYGGVPFTGVDQITVGYGNIDNIGNTSGLTQINPSQFYNPFVDAAELELFVGSNGRMAQAELGLAYARSQDDNQYYGIIVSQQFTPSLSVGLGYARLDEVNQVLGLEIAGAYGEIDNTATDAYSLSVDWVQNDLFAFAKYTIGQSDVNMMDSNGLITDFDSLQSSAWALGLGKFNVFAENDRLDFGISQSLRIDEGDIVLDPEKLAEGETSTVDAAPEGREMTYEVGYTLPINEQLSLSANVAHITQQDHDENADDLTAIGMKIQYSF